MSIEVQAHLLFLSALVFCLVSVLFFDVVFFCREEQSLDLQMK